MITTRHAQANSPSFSDTYDVSIPNNMYGWAMSRPFPTHGFRVLQQGEIEALGELSDDVEDGYIFEVDLSYPHLHDSHDDYRLAPESLEIVRDIYSPGQRTPQRILTPNLRDKVKYVVHYRN